MQLKGLFKIQNPSYINISVTEQTWKKEMATASFVSSACLARPLLPRVLRRQNLNDRYLSSLQFQFPQAHRVGSINKRFGSRAIVAAGGKSEVSGVPRSVPVRVAHELLQAGHRYLDVRTSEEFSAGHPLGAINIPYMFRAGSGMTKNPNFLEEVSSHFGKDTEIVVGCQAGKRSIMAATDLLSAGFTGVTDVAGGYSAWTQNGLPTEQ